MNVWRLLADFSHLISIMVRAGCDARRGARARNATRSRRELAGAKPLHARGHHWLGWRVCSSRVELHMRVCTQS
jgi:hypothetical protein